MQVTSPSSGRCDGARFSVSHSTGINIHGGQTEIHHAVLPKYLGLIARNVVDSNK
jgi:hypothetical protein